jgi:NADH dehydrogenase (ubiquinone) Fe-S protein 2
MGCRVPLIEKSNEKLIECSN